jgi:signal peptidase
MHLIQKISLSLVIALALVFGGAIVLFNWSVTGWKALAVPTGSMRPAINPGSLVLVHSVPNSSLKVGDIITYANPTKLTSSVTHRIIKVTTIGSAPAFITKGDANPTADRAIVGGLVQGRAVWHVPYLGAWLSWTHTVIGVSILVYLPALLVMIEEMRLLAAYYKKTMPYKAAVIKSRERTLAREKSKFKIAPTTMASIVLIIGSIFFAIPVHALLTTNTVSLAPNRITIAARATPPPLTCTTSGGNSTNITVSGSGNSNVSVNNSSNQNAQTGNASSGNNTNGGNATSGNATNCNSTNININIH